LSRPPNENAATARGCRVKGPGFEGPDRRGRDRVMPEVRGLAGPGGQPAASW
jgi:hypothetical protein